MENNFREIKGRRGRLEAGLAQIHVALARKRLDLVEG